MRTLSLQLIGLCVCAAAPLGAGQAPNAGAPETFHARAQTGNAAGASLSAPITVHIGRYTPDFDRKVVEEALRIGGYPGFLPALRKAPEVGQVELGGRKYAIRWARQAPSGQGNRTIVVVTDKPVFFVGGGLADAKPRAGYEVAVIQLVVDDGGNGTGTMAAAARVKPGGETGVQIDDYADMPIALVEVTRK
jgi:hypothetical protein